MKLLSLTLQNFKGIKSLHVDLQGDDCTIKGDNGTGKTTSYDAFLWLLFDKDSTNRKDFSLKPHDAQGNEIHYLETSVEGALQLDDGRRVTLRKVYSEKWTKRRGEEDRVFSGHETAFFVDGVPRTKGEYTKFVDGLIDEGTFRLITSPAYFNTVLKEDDRREALFEMLGDVPDDISLMQDHEDFRHLLSAVAGGRTIEDAKKTAQNTLKRTNEELVRIPVRIDELTRSLPDLAKFSEDEWERIARLRDNALQKITDIDTQLADAQTLAQQHARRLQTVEDLKSKLRTRESELRTEARRGIDEAFAEIERLQLDIGRKKNQIENITLDIKNRETSKKQLEERLPALRTQYNEVAEMEFVAPTDDEIPVCSLCGQPLPQHVIDEGIETQRYEFYKQRDTRLDEIQTDGKSCAARINGYNGEIADLQAAADEHQKDIQAIEKRVAELRKIASQEAPTVIPLEDEQYFKIMTSLKQAEQDAGAADARSSAEKLLDQKRDLQTSADGYAAKLAARDQHQKTQERINELKVQEKKFSALVVAQEKLIYDIERFISYKCGKLEERINELFPVVRNLFSNEPDPDLRIHWKLFDTQINGGIRDCCVCMLNGVPWPDANLAKRINAGLFIVDLISRARGVTAPIFIDNRESVNRLYETDAQIINLVVTKDKALRVETAKSEEVA